MVVTRQQALDHVFDTILALDAEAPIRALCAAQNIKGIPGLLRLTESQLSVEEFASIDGLTPQQKLKVTEINSILDLKRWYDENTPDNEAWVALTADQFDTFQLAPPTTATPPPATLPTTSPTTITTAIAGHTQADAFSRSFKRSIDDYSTLARREDYAVWIRTTKNVLRMHDLQYINDPSHPLYDDAARTTPTDVALYTVANRFLAAVLVAKITYPAGENICEQNPTNARTILELVHADCTESVYGQELVTNMKDAVQKKKFNLSTQTGETFLQEWERDMQRLNQQMKNVKPSSTGVDDDDKRLWLDNSIKGDAIGSSAIINALANEAANGTPMTFERYLAYLRLIFAKTATKLTSVAVRSQATNATDAGRPPVAPPTTERGRVGEPDRIKQFQQRCKDTGFYIERNEWLSPAWTDDKKDAFTTLRKKAWAAGKNFHQMSATERAPFEDNDNTDAMSALTTVPATVATTESNLRAVLSNRAAAARGTRLQSANGTIVTTQTNDEVSINGISYRRACMALRNIQICNYERATPTKGSLVDGGSNGGIAGDDCTHLEPTFDTANVTGVTNDELTGLPIGTAVALTHTADGEPVLLYMHQYAFYRGKTVHSKGQWSAFGSDVDDRSSIARIPGRQSVITMDADVFPLHIRDGLPMFDMRPPTPEEAADQSLREIHITSDISWDPTSIDCEFGSSHHHRRVASTDRRLGDGEQDDGEQEDGEQEDGEHGDVALPLATNPTGVRRSARFSPAELVAKLIDMGHYSEIDGVLTVGGVSYDRVTDNPALTPTVGEINLAAALLMPKIDLEKVRMELEKPGLERQANKMAKTTNNSADTVHQETTRDVSSSQETTAEMAKTTNNSADSRLCDRDNECDDDKIDDDDLSLAIHSTSSRRSLRFGPAELVAKLITMGHYSEIGGIMTVGGVSYERVTDTPTRPEDLAVQLFDMGYPTTVDDVITALKHANGEINLAAALLMRTVDLEAARLRLATNTVEEATNAATAQQETTCDALASAEETTAKMAKKSNKNNKARRYRARRAIARAEQRHVLQEEKDLTALLCKYAAENENEPALLPRLQDASDDDELSTDDDELLIAEYSTADADDELSTAFETPDELLLTQDATAHFLLGSETERTDSLTTMLRKWGAIAPLPSADAKAHEPEGLGWWIGPAEPCGAILNYNITTNDKHRVTTNDKHRVIRPAAVGEPMKAASTAVTLPAPADGEPTALESADGEPTGDGEPTIFRASELLNAPDNPAHIQLTKCSPDDLVGLPYLHHEKENGQQLRAKKLISDDEVANKKGEETVDDVITYTVLSNITYTVLSNIIEEQHANETEDADLPSVRLHGPNPDTLLPTTIMNAKSIRFTSTATTVATMPDPDPDEPLLTQDELELDEKYPDCLAKTRTDCTITLAHQESADGEHDSIFQDDKLYEKGSRRMINATKHKSQNSGPIYKYGIQVPMHGEKDALRIDKENGNTLFTDAMRRELHEVSFATFRDVGVGSAISDKLRGDGHSKFYLHWVFDVKPDLRCKARIVASGNITSPDMCDTYSSIESLPRTQLVLTLATALHGLNGPTADSKSASMRGVTNDAPSVSPLESLSHKIGDSSKQVNSKSCKHANGMLVAS